MFCPKCGTQNDDKARFCIKCGQSLAVAPSPQLVRQQHSRSRQLLFIAPAVLVLLVAVAVGIHLATRQIVHTSGWIAYQTQAPNDTVSLWVVRPDGSDRSELVRGVDSIAYTQIPTEDQRYEYSPFLPKNGWMLWIAQEGGEVALYSHALGEGEAKTIIRGVDDVDFRLSPDGNRIGVAIWHEGESSLQVLDPNGKNMVALLTGADGTLWWNWLPNSKRLVVRLYDGEYSLFVMDADGDNRVTLAEHVDGVDCSMSSQGDKVAYSAQKGGTWDVYTANADGEDPIRLAGGLADATLFDFSPNGKELIMSASADGYSYDLYVMETDGTGRVTLASDMEEAYGAFVRDGKQVIFQLREDGWWSFYLADADGEDQNLIARTANRLTTAWTPKGRTLVQGLQRDGEWEVYAVELATGERIDLLSNVDELGSFSVLDRKRVLFSARDGDAWNLYVAQLDGEGTVVLAGPADEFRGYDASPNGQRIVFSEVNLGVSNLYVIDADGRNREKLADDGFSPVWSE